MSQSARNALAQGAGIQYTDASSRTAYVARRACRPHAPWQATVALCGGSWLGPQRASSQQGIISQQQQSEQLQCQLSCKEEELKCTSEELSNLQTKLAHSQRAVAASEGELVVAAERIADLLEQKEQHATRVDVSTMDIEGAVSEHTSNPQLLEEIGTTRSELFAERETLS